MPLYKINTDEIQSFLARSDINFSYVAETIGLSKMTLSNLRTGRTDLLNGKLETIIKIQSYIDKLKLEEKFL